MRENYGTMYHICYLYLADAFVQNILERRAAPTGNQNRINSLNGITAHHSTTSTAYVKVLLKDTCSAVLRMSQILLLQMTSPAMKKNNSHGTLFRHRMKVRIYSASLLPVDQRIMGENLSPLT